MRTLTACLLPCLLLAPALAKDEKPKPAASYRLPYPAGTSHPCTQSVNGSTSHTGNLRYAIDFGMPQGSKVCAARGGRVVKAVDEEKHNGRNGKYGGSGNHIKIDHGDGTTGIYLHLKYEGALVEEGEFVLQGDVIGLSGNTGYSTGPHLHFQVNKGVKSIPIQFADVETDGGVPHSGKSYVSGNVPGIPAVLKDRLVAWRRSARLAEEEGAFALALDLLEKMSDVKLKVAYPPQEEARRKMAALRKLPAETAARLEKERTGKGFEEAAQELLLARVRLRGVPGATQLKDVEEAMAKDPRFRDIQRATRPRARLLGRYLKALKREMKGKLKAARREYKVIAKKAGDSPLAKRARARQAHVEKLLQARRAPPRK